MKKYEIDCFQVTEYFDRDSTHIAYTSTRQLAEKIADKQKNYRTVSTFKKTFVVYETMQDVEDYSLAKLKNSGLAKLTPEERQALGL